MGTIKVLFVASEGVPYIKTGGLADVVGSLPQELKRKNIDIRVVMPYYKNIADLSFKTEHCSTYDVWVSWRKKQAEVLIHTSEVTTYFISNPEYFYRDNIYGYQDDDERYAFFSKAVLEMLPKIGFIPDIIHCNDWQTGPICLYLKEQYYYNDVYKNIRSIYTIHNIQYQGNFSRDSLDVLGLGEEYFTLGSIECYDMVNYMKAGIVYADYITTVSPSYAMEIQSKDYGYGLDGILRQRSDKVYGIINGIDEKKYNPDTDSFLEYNYSKDEIENKKNNKTYLQNTLGLNKDNSMLIAVVTRLVEQKGLDLLKADIDGKWILDKLMENNIQIVILGTGEKKYEDMFRYLEERYPKRIKANIMFSEELSHKIYGSSDILWMPSLFEPCGLGQLIAMKYGVVPIVRKTGGLKDTVAHYNLEEKTGTGFEFEQYNGYWLYKKTMEAYDIYINNPEEFDNIRKNGMKSNFSWGESADRYIGLYRKLIN